MQVFLQIVQLIPALIALVKEIEKVIPQGGHGQAKLAAVRQIIEAAYGGLSEIWPVIEKVVTVLVGLFNSTGVFQKSNENLGS